MDGLFTVEVHHLGHFVEDPVRYVDGVVNHVDEIDPEKWSKLEGCGVDKSIGGKGGQKQVQNAGLKSAPSQAVEGAPSNASKEKKGAVSKGKKGAPSKANKGGLNNAQKGGPSKAPKAPQAAADKALTIDGFNGPPPKKGLKRSRVSNVLLKDIYDFS